MTQKKKRISSNTSSTITPSTSIPHSYEYREEIIRWIICLTGSILLFSLLSLLISHIYQPDPQQALVTAKNLLGTKVSSCQPEPVESLLFKLSLLFFPISLFGLYRYSLQFNFRKINSSKSLFRFIFYACFFLVLLLIYHAFSSSNPLHNAGLNELDKLAQTNFQFYFHHLLLQSTPFLYGLLFPIILSLFLFVRKAKNTTIKNIRFIVVGTAYLIAGLSLLAIIKMNIYDFPATWQEQYDFNSVYYSMTQVYAGSPMLVDHFTNTYGLYPQFLNPIFQLTGLNVFNFTIVMSVLIGFIFISCFVFMKKYIDEKIILLLGFISVLFLPYLYNRITITFDSYFALYPIRLLFPSLVLFFAVLYHSCTNKRKNLTYYSALFILPFGILWNPDFGIVSFLAWLLMLTYSKFYNTQGKIAWFDILKIWISGLFSVIVCLVIYALSIKLFYGSFPDFTLLFSSLTVFSQLGYFMLPMTLWHPWNLVILIFLTGFLYAISHLVRKEITPKSTALFLVSILGCGVFAYFQGRSHNWNLMPALLFAFIVLSILADELWKSIQTGHLKILWLPFALMLFILSFSCIEIAGKTANLYPLTQKNHGKKISPQEKKEIERNIRFLQQQVKQGEKIILLTSNKFQGLYLDHTKTISAVNPGFLDLLLVSDIKRLENIARDSVFKIFLDGQKFYYNEFSDLRSIIAGSYEVTASNGSMSLLEKRKKQIPDIPYFNSPSDAILLHRKYTDDTTGINQRKKDASGIQDIHIGNEFSAELLFYNNQQHYPASLLSNATDKSGFAILKSMNPTVPEEYFVAFGQRGIPLKLPFKQWIYMTVNVKGSLVSIFINGQLIGNFNMVQPYQTSTMPLYIGNYPNNRYYTGAISEIAVHNHILTANEITQRWMNISTDLQLVQK